MSGNVAAQDVCQGKDSGASSRRLVRKHSDNEGGITESWGESQEVLQDKQRVKSLVYFCYLTTQRSHHGEIYFRFAIVLGLSYANVHFYCIMFILRAESKFV